MIKPKTGRHFFLLLLCSRVVRIMSFTGILEALVIGIIELVKERAKAKARVAPNLAGE
jgi:hypothetical protein